MPTCLWHFIYLEGAKALDERQVDRVLTAPLTPLATSSSAAASARRAARNISRSSISWSKGNDDDDAQDTEAAEKCLVHFS